MPYYPNNFLTSAIITPQEFGARGNGIVDDTAAIQAAINAANGREVRFPPGTYKVTTTLQINKRFVRLVGETTGRGAVGGTEIAYSGTGPCIQIDVDDALPWDSNLYDGYQDQWFENLWISHSAPDTSLGLDAALLYKAGAYGIRDWRGGGVRIKDCAIEKFEYCFWGVQSDINSFKNLTIAYSRFGIYCGPRSDQFTIEDLYAFFCDTCIVIDRPQHTRIVDPQIVGCGTASRYPIEIYRGSASVRIERPWFEHLQGYNGTDQIGFIGVGLTDGYGATTSSVQGLDVEEPLIYTPAIGIAYHTKRVVVMGAAVGVRVDRPIAPVGTSLSNLDSIIEAPAGTAFTNAQAQAVVSGVQSSLSLAKLYVNNGTGAPDFCAIADGPSGAALTSILGRHFFNRFGAAAGAEQFYLSSEGAAGQFWVVAPTYATGQIGRLKLTRCIRFENAVPSAGKWERGDIVFDTAPSAAGKIGWVCTVSGDFSGVAPTFKQWGPIDA